MKTTYNLVADAIAPVMEFVKTAKSGDEYSTKSGKRTRAMRLDFESDEREPESVRWYHMTCCLKDDIMDLVTNGDVNNGSDPLLNIFDGEVKRGKSLSHIEFPTVHLFTEYKPRKNTYEYTLYLVIYVEFED